MVILEGSDVQVGTGPPRINRCLYQNQCTRKNLCLAKGCSQGSFMLDMLPPKCLARFLALSENIKTFGEIFGVSR